MQQNDHKLAKAPSSSYLQQANEKKIPDNAKRTAPPVGRIDLMLAGQWKDLGEFFSNWSIEAESKTAYTRIEVTEIAKTLE